MSYMMMDVVLLKVLQHNAFVMAPTNAQGAVADLCVEIFGQDDAVYEYLHLRALLVHPSLP
jgi:hypothetical protein